MIVWDGGNNDFPFYESDLHVTVIDPHRLDHELSYNLQEIGRPDLTSVLDDFIKKHNLG